MNLFGKKKTENWIIKLFKITDKNSAVEFDMENRILSTTETISQTTKLKATDFSFNYKNPRKTLNGFKKALKTEKEIVYAFVGFDSDKNRTYFTIDNPMLNWNEQPENSTINVCIQVSTEFSEQISIEKIAENLIENYDFEYGYITKLPSNFDSGTERKIEKGLFSITVKSDKSESVWNFHSVGILDGYLKCIYPINYLNKSHLDNENTKDLTLKYGTTSKITDDIYKWTLNTKELDILKNNEQIKKISIITPELEFLKTDKAKLFNDKMKLKKPVANNV